MLESYRELVLSSTKPFAFLPLASCQHRSFAPTTDGGARRR